MIRLYHYIVQDNEFSYSCPVDNVLHYKFSRARINPCWDFTMLVNQENNSPRARLPDELLVEYDFVKQRLQADALVFVFSPLREISPKGDN